MIISIMKISKTKARLKPSQNSKLIVPIIHFNQMKKNKEEFIFVNFGSN